MRRKSSAYTEQHGIKINKCRETSMLPDTLTQQAAYHVQLQRQQCRRIHEYFPTSHQRIETHVAFVRIRRKPSDIPVPMYRDLYSQTHEALTEDGLTVKHDVNYVMEGFQIAVPLKTEPARPHRHPQPLQLSRTRQIVTSKLNLEFRLSLSTLESFLRGSSIAPIVRKITTQLMNASNFIQTNTVHLQRYTLACRLLVFSTQEAPDRVDYKFNKS